MAPAAAKRRPRAKALADADDEEVMSPAVVPQVPAIRLGSARSLSHARDIDSTLTHPCVHATGACCGFPGSCGEGYLCNMQDI